MVVGAGGLGCPALQYLAAAGIGRLGVVDHDNVELSNLQRQVLHTESRIGINKAQSSAAAIREINSTIHVDIYTDAFTIKNAKSLMASYDVILDCTDNAPTRYLLSDVAVSLAKPLVSGAAQKLEGQLCTYNLNNTGPCYRCIFRKPPPPAALASCEETGILGVVTGVIGNLQALEAIKIITGIHEGTPSMLIFSALGQPPFRSVKLRQRRPDCLACGSDGLKRADIEQVDYVQFCGGAQPDWHYEGLQLGTAGTRTYPEEVKQKIDDRPQLLKLIDVRSPTEYNICHLPGSINIPLAELSKDRAISLDPSDEVIVLCRLGNDSKIGTEILRRAYPAHQISDMVGGLVAWAQRVDPTFPVY